MSHKSKVLLILSLLLTVLSAMIVKYVLFHTTPLLLFWHSLYLFPFCCLVVLSLYRRGFLYPVFRMYPDPKYHSKHATVGIARIGKDGKIITLE